MLVTVAAMLLSVAGHIDTAASRTPVATPAPAIAASANKGAKPHAYNPRVCVVDTITGSRVPMRECRLLGQWRTLGIDPLPGR